MRRLYAGRGPNCWASCRQVRFRLYTYAAPHQACPMDEVAFPPADIQAAAALMELVIPAECLAGVAANLTVLADHLRNIEAHESAA